MTEYDKFLSLVDELITFGTIGALIGWDTETYMPERALPLRTKQRGFFAGLMHEKRTNPEFKNLLETLEADDSLDKIQKRNVYLFRKNFDRATKIPKELAMEMAQQREITNAAWIKAKKENKFKNIFAPELKKLVELSRKILKLIEPDKDPYDAALDQFEPNMTANELTKIFDDLKPHLVGLLNKIEKSRKKPDLSIIQRPVNKKIQLTIANNLMSLVGYTDGRVDESVHPFTIGYYDDVRITTKIVEDDFADSFFSTMHESGHALYEQYQNPDYKFQPVGGAASMAIHESQSRFWENIIGRSPEFWKFYMNKFQDLTAYGDINFDEFMLAINKVERSKIRVTADEVTYCLHIILRFEIERDLIQGKIEVEELPELWNKKIKDYLDLEIENDSEGVMQDVHWGSGMFGYFPSYAVGNIISGQLLHTMKKEIDINSLVENGEFLKIKDWLNDHVYKYGSLYDPLELVKVITGEELNSKYYVEYLKEKYSRLYNL